jgi:hypothetical protein
MERAPPLGFAKRGAVPAPSGGFEGLVLFGFVEKGGRSKGNKSVDFFPGSFYDIFD